MTKSTAAQAAALIRKEIKTSFPGLKFTCKSSNFSMGNAVDIDLTENTDKETVSAVNQIAAKYQYGSFDGMTDSYSYSNRNDSIPQVKYVCVSVCSFLK